MNGSAAALKFILQSYPDEQGLWWLRQPLRAF